RSSGANVAIPLEAVRSTRRAMPEDISIGASGAIVMHGEKAIPFSPLASLLDGDAWSHGRGWTIVVVGGVEGLAAIGVERLLGTAKIVVRPLPARMTASPLVAAGLLDADGNPQLVLDPDRMVEAAQRGTIGARDSRPAKLPVLVVDDSLTT